MREYCMLFARGLQSTLQKIMFLISIFASFSSKNIKTSLKQDENNIKNTDLENYFCSTCLFVGLIKCLCLLTFVS